MKGLLLRKVTHKSDFLKEAINNTWLICSQTGNAFSKIVTKINCFAIVTYSILNSSFRLLERHPSPIFLVQVLLLASVYENQSKTPVKFIFLQSNANNCRKVLTASQTIY